MWSAAVQISKHYDRLQQIFDVCLAQRGDTVAWWMALWPYRKKAGHGVGWMFGLGLGLGCIQTLSLHEYNLLVKNPTRRVISHQWSHNVRISAGVTHWHVSYSKLHVCGPVTPHVTDPCTQSAATSQSEIMTAHAHSVHCVHTWPGTKWTTRCHLSPGPRQKSHCELHSSTHWWDRLTPQQPQREVWVRQPTTIIPSCHYLPSHSLLCSPRQMHKRCARENIHKHRHQRKHVCDTHLDTKNWVRGGVGASPLVVTRCQVAGWALSIELTEISILAAILSGNVSLSIWVKQREEVHGGSPPTFTNTCTCLHQVCWSRDKNEVIVSITCRFLISEAKR